MFAYPFADLLLAVLALSRLQTLGKASEIWVFASAVHRLLIGHSGDFSYHRFLLGADNVDRSRIFVLTCPDRPIFLGCKLAFKVASLTSHQSTSTTCLMNLAVIAYICAEKNEILFGFTNDSENSHHCKTQLGAERRGLQHYVFLSWYDSHRFVTCHEIRCANQRPALAEGSFTVPKRIFGLHQFALWSRRILGGPSGQYGTIIGQNPIIKQRGRKFQPVRWKAKMPSRIRAAGCSPCTAKSISMAQHAKAGSQTCITYDNIYQFYHRIFRKCKCDTFKQWLSLQSMFNSRSEMFVPGVGDV